MRARLQGRMKCRLDDRGFGFIRDDNGDDFFVHARNPSGISVLAEGARSSSSASTVAMAAPRTQAFNRGQRTPHKAWPIPIE